MSNQWTVEWTQKGVEKLAAALRGGPKLDVVAMGVGDGNGVEVDPRGAVGLVHEVARANATISDVLGRPELVEVLMRLPMNVGGFTARELSVIDRANDVLCVGNIPQREIPVAGSGAVCEAAFKVILLVSNKSVINLTFDQTVIFASQNYVTNAITVHQAQANPHPVYLLKTDALNFYANKEHTHVIANVPGLQMVLDAKQNVSDAQVQAIPLGQLIFFGGA